MKKTNRRFFTAIKFNDEVVQALDHNAKVIAENGKIRLADPENYHLTLIYIGATARVSEARQAFHASVREKFEVEFSNVRFLKRNDGMLVWQVVENNADLSALHKQLNEELSWRGFANRNREFRPHVTLGRDFNLKEDQELSIDEVAEINAKLVTPPSFLVESVGLYESKVVDGKLVYVEIDSLDLY